MKLKDTERLDDLQFNNLQIIQDKTGYLFTSDAVALANYVKPCINAKVVELCSGSGVISMLINAKNKVNSIKMVEIQECMADMSKRSLEYNNITNIEVVNDRLQGIHKAIGTGFDVVVCNPPYKARGTATKLNDNKVVAIAKHEVEVTLDEIVSEADKLLKFGGDFYIVNKEERLVDMLTILREHKIEPKELVVLPSKSGANTIMIKAKKGGKGGIKITLK